MSVYLVTWNLNKEGSEYASARRELMSRLLAFDHAYEGRELDTLAFVRVPDNHEALDIYNHLITALDKNDRLVVTLVPSHNRIFYVSDKTKHWLDQRL